jgi:hypothetical protein
MLAAGGTMLVLGGATIGVGFVTMSVTKLVVEHNKVCRWWCTGQFRFVYLNAAAWWWCGTEKAAGEVPRMLWLCQSRLQRV